MNIENRTVLILGGSGLVGRAVARALLPHRPRALVVSALGRAEAEDAVDELRAEGGVPEDTSLAAEWGNLFSPEPLEQRRRDDVLADADARGLLLDDVYGPLDDDMVERSAFGALLTRHRPDLIVDCVNTATAFAYENVYESAERLRAEAREEGGANPELVERHLATLHLPRLIRHVQIALAAMRRAETDFYLKIGTAGTGGMGLNIPFTHSEERPSRMMLSKAGLAGAHTLLLFLMARTPDAPAVKEIKPAAAISWKRIAYGEVRRGGEPIECWDATRAVGLAEAFGDDAGDAYASTEEMLEGVYLDAGENGLFSLGEFETLTALGLMEYITPEEIAGNVVREIRGEPTGRDVVAALDASASGPTYRAGVLRAAALERMTVLEQEHDVEAVAYEMLGPPRLSKLLFEGALLERLFADLSEAARLDPDATAERAATLIEEDVDLRTRILTIGLPILLPDGERLLRGPEVKVAPGPGERSGDARVADRGWVDLRPANWRTWRERAAEIADEIEALPGAGEGSRADVAADGRPDLRPGRLAAWVFRREDRGERGKR